MDSKIRKSLFAPIVDGSLSATIPELRIHLENGVISAPAQLSLKGESFIFTAYFSPSNPRGDLGQLKKNYLSQADQITITGDINGDFAFRCRDIFPPAGYSESFTRGTSKVAFRSSRLELVPEGLDAMDTHQLEEIIKRKKPTKKHQNRFSAHIIFHGPESHIMDAGSETKKTNDFLGEATSSSFDTHIFSGKEYKAALIQNELELHLHIRSRGNCKMDDSIELTDRIIRSIGFVLGFHPWPCYREFRFNHRVIERWISPHLNLKQSFLAPISESLWATYASEKNSPLHRVIPTIEHGLKLLPKITQQRVETLLWHVRMADLASVPEETKLMTVCSAFDGLWQLVIEVADGKRLDTDKLWKAGAKRLGLSWERWAKEIFELRGKYRHHLSHGRLWLHEDGGFEEMDDYARLGCAFMLLVAAYCGYDGPVLADPYQPRKAVISELKEAAI